MEGRYKWYSNAFMCSMYRLLCYLSELMKNSIHNVIYQHRQIMQQETGYANQTQLFVFDWYSLFHIAEFTVIL
jgi:hypothetical protein